VLGTEGHPGRTLPDRLSSSSGERLIPEIQVFCGEKTRICSLRLQDETEGFEVSYDETIKSEL